MRLRRPVGAAWGRRREPEAAPGATVPAADAEELPQASLVASIPRVDRFTAQDLVVEAISDVGSRPGRLVMTLAGTVLGVGALVATLGFAQTAEYQIARQFDAVRSTQVVVSPGSAQTQSGDSVATARLPWDSVERVGRLAGVEAAATISELALDGEEITTVPVNDPSAAAIAAPRLMAADADLLDVIGSSIVTGRMFDSGHASRADRVVVIGERAADRLGLNRIDRQPAVFIGDRPYAVIGIYGESQARGELADAIIMPTATARGDRALVAPDELQIRIAPGAGEQVGEQASLALLPNSPEDLDVSAPSASASLRETVQSDVTVVFLILGGIVLLAGALGIANVTMLTVSERIPEIGLRRALGATRRQIGAQFVIESAVIGLLGGLMGAALAVVSLVGLSVARGWTPIIDVWVTVGGVLLGSLVGLAAGWLPARRASRIEPVSALRGGA
ncbi:ABC transporter permease [Microcella daejeonensis]|uniref:ABC transporter permease n=1 Tax=Microcella daejeonensis TaxID=2994971 RepID=UPI002270D7C5|nr:ABC transporter permease [Microcella daejeonensis]WAB82826.1 ABC transporter permease [Microcella daejeonensis]